MNDKRDPLERRAFLKTGVLATSAAAAMSVASAAGKKDGDSATDGASLREKFFGCIAGCHIGSAMGAAVAKTLPDALGCVFDWDVPIRLNSIWIMTVMPFIRGETLRNVLASRAVLGSPLKIDTVMKWSRQLVSFAYHAYKNADAMCHSDIKLGNIMVETATGAGLRVLNATGSGLWVDAAGDYGVRLDSADFAGFYVGSTGGDGLYVGSAGGFGARVGSVGGHGVYVDSAGQDGMYVGSATYNGLRVDSAVMDGVHIGSAGGYAGYFGGDVNITGTCYGCEVAAFGVNASEQTLGVGDVVSIQGIVASGFKSQPVLMQVGPAGSGHAVIGVVLGGAESESAAERGLDEDRGPDAEGQRLVPGEGPAPAGGYVSILLFGPAQVRASMSGGPIAAGTRLVAGDGGGARALRTVEVEGVQVAESAPVVGIALEDASAEGLIWVLVNPQ